MLSDILPTAYEVGVLNGAVRPGDVVAVVGAGPVGLSAILGAKLFSPGHVVAIDLADSRLEAAKGFGADVVVNNGREDAVAVVRVHDRRARCGRGHRGGRRARDVRALRRAGATGRSRGQHRRPWPGGHAPPRIALDPGRDHHDRAGRHVLDPHAAPAPDLRAHRRRLPLPATISNSGQMLDAYDTFARAAETGALKVVISR